MIPESTNHLFLRIRANIALSRALLVLADDAGYKWPHHADNNDRGSNRATDARLVDASWLILSRIFSLGPGNGTQNRCLHYCSSVDPLTRYHVDGPVHVHEEPINLSEFVTWLNHDT